jgi:hypothetical protein
MKDIPEYIQNLSLSLAQKKILITGYQIHEIDFKLPKNIHILHTTEDLKQHLLSL